MSLNEFERKILLNNLGDFSVLNLVQYEDSFSQLHYIVFFKVDDLYFSEKVIFSNQKDNGVVISASEYLDVLKDSLSSSINDIRELLSSTAEVSSSDMLRVANLLFFHLVNEHFNYSRCGFISDSLNLGNHTGVIDRIFELLKNKNCAKKVFQTLSFDFNIYFSNMEEEIINFDKRVGSE